MNAGYLVYSKMDGVLATGIYMLITGARYVAASNAVTTHWKNIIRLVLPNKCVQMTLPMETQVQIEVQNKKIIVHGRKN
ncbi:unnamed protein product [Urochloa humidicola]